MPGQFRLRRLGLAPDGRQPFLDGGDRPFDAGKLAADFFHVLLRDAQGLHDLTGPTLLGGGFLLQLGDLLGPGLDLDLALDQQLVELRAAA
ncbi:MAG TPA: hypothetical protein VMI53_00260, partial [Opitutaceae bacterium]|nr:hypothetical protein [Opitutaceae bacterium]